MHSSTSMSNFTIMIAISPPVLVPAKRSKASWGRMGLSDSLILQRSARRMSKVESPRTPPPSQARTLSRREDMAAGRRVESTKNGYDERRDQLGGRRSVRRQNRPALWGKASSAARPCLMLDPGGGKSRLQAS